MAEMKFEEALKKLESIVEDLEGGSLSLDESLEKYEEGIRLSKACSKKLEVAKKKVEILLKSEDGSLELKSFDEKNSRRRDEARSLSEEKKQEDRGRPFLNLTKLIEKDLDKFLPYEKTSPKTLHEAMRYSVFSGGKRIRPVILIETAIACGGSVKEAIAASCSIEFVHAYSLIHDDLPSMDDDDYRRGKPSCHKKFGEAIAILAGDALLTLAFGVIAREYTPATASEMIKELSQAIGSCGMVGGQAFDIAQDKDIDKIDHLKTAKLFEASAVLGALSARADKKKIMAIRKYGVNIGMVFQAVDDKLDGEMGFSEKRVKALANRAKDALKIFGKKGKRLGEIADYILTRKI